VALTASPAFAQRKAPAPVVDEASRNKARQKLVEGVELLKAGDYNEALLRFQEAYALVPSPKIHYNFGLAYLGLARYAEALDSFEKFLAEAGDATKDTRDKAEEHRKGLRGRVALVEVTADAAGADVLVDGRVVGRTPLAKPVYVDPGPHQIVVQKAGTGSPYLERITPQSGQSIKVTAKLAREAPAVRPAEPPPMVEAPPVATAPSLPEAPAATVTTTSAPERQDKFLGLGKQIWGISLGAFGLASLGTGVAFGILAKQQSDAIASDARSEKIFNPKNEDSGRSYQTLQIVFTTIGAAAIGTGAVLYVLHLNERSETASASRGLVITPVFTPGFAGASAVTSF
jgi:hypothetical protein